jgi:hypothetical protein
MAAAVSVSCRLHLFTRCCLAEAHGKICDLESCHAYEKQLLKQLTCAAQPYGDDGAFPAAITPAVQQGTGAGNSYLRR